MMLAVRQSNSTSRKTKKKKKKTPTFANPYFWHSKQEKKQPSRGGRSLEWVAT
jgi:hypothetical protein